MRLCVPLLDGGAEYARGGGRTGRESGKGKGSGMGWEGKKGEGKQRKKRGRMKGKRGGLGCGKERG